VGYAGGADREARASIRVKGVKIMKQAVKVQASHKPIYCRECRGQNTFERCPSGDIGTESGKPFMLKWQCTVCGKTCLTSNREVEDEA